MNITNQLVRGSCKKFGDYKILSKNDSQIVAGNDALDFINWFKSDPPKIFLEIEKVALGEPSSIKNSNNEVISDLEGLNEHIGKISEKFILVELSGPNTTQMDSNILDIVETHALRQDESIKAKLLGNYILAQELIQGLSGLKGKNEQLNNQVNLQAELTGLIKDISICLDKHKLGEGQLIVPKLVLAYGQTENFMNGAVPNLEKINHMTALHANICINAVAPELGYLAMLAIVSSKTGNSMEGVTNTLLKFQKIKLLAWLKKYKGLNGSLNLNDEKVIREFLGLHRNSRLTTFGCNTLSLKRFKQMRLSTSSAKNNSLNKVQEIVILGQEVNSSNLLQMSFAQTKAKLTELVKHKKWGNLSSLLNKQEAFSNVSSLIFEANGLRGTLYMHICNAFSTATTEKDKTDLNKIKTLMHENLDDKTIKISNQLDTELTQCSYLNIFNYLNNTQWFTGKYSAICEISSILIAIDKNQKLKPQQKQDLITYLMDELQAKNEGKFATIRIRRGSGKLAAPALGTGLIYSANTVAKGLGVISGGLPILSDAVTAVSPPIFTYGSSLNQYTDTTTWKSIKQFVGGYAKQLQEDESLNDQPGEIQRLSIPKPCNLNKSFALTGYISTDANSVNQLLNEKNSRQLKANLKTIIESLSQLPQEENLVEKESNPLYVFHLLTYRSDSSFVLDKLYNKLRIHYQSDQHTYQELISQLNQVWIFANLEKFPQDDSLGSFKDYILNLSRSGFATARDTLCCFYKIQGYLLKEINIVGQPGNYQQSEEQLMIIEKITYLTKLIENAKKDHSSVFHNLVLRNKNSLPVKQFLVRIPAVMALAASTAALTPAVSLPLWAMIATLCGGRVIFNLGLKASNWINYASYLGTKQSTSAKENISNQLAQQIDNSKSKKDIDYFKHIKQVVETRQVSSLSTHKNNNVLLENEHDEGNSRLRSSALDNEQSLLLITQKIDKLRSWAIDRETAYQSLVEIVSLIKDATLATKDKYALLLHELFLLIYKQSPIAKRLIKETTMESLNYQSHIDVGTLNASWPQIFQISGAPLNPLDLVIGSSVGISLYLTSFLLGLNSSGNNNTKEWRLAVSFLKTELFTFYKDNKEPLNLSEKEFMEDLFKLNTSKTFNWKLLKWLQRDTTTAKAYRNFNSEKGLSNA